MTLQGLAYLICSSEENFPPRPHLTALQTVNNMSGLPYSGRWERKITHNPVKRLLQQVPGYAGRLFTTYHSSKTEKSQWKSDQLAFYRWGLSVVVFEDVCVNQ